MLQEINSSTPDFFLKLYQKHSHKDYAGITKEEMDNAVGQLDMESKMLSYQHDKFMNKIDTLKLILEKIKETI